MSALKLFNLTGDFSEDIVRKRVNYSENSVCDPNDKYPFSEVLLHMTLRTLVVFRWKALRFTRNVTRSIAAGFSVAGVLQSHVVGGLRSWNDAIEDF